MSKVEKVRIERPGALESLGFPLLSGSIRCPGGLEGGVMRCLDLRQSMGTDGG